MRLPLVIVGAAVASLIGSTACRSSESPPADAAATSDGPATADTGRTPGASAETQAVLDSLYGVAEYDASRDPDADLAMVVARAQREGKRILLEVGGEWCRWCHILDGFLQDHPNVVRSFESGFVVMKVDYEPEHTNEAFLSQYPEIPGYPHFFVLDSDGTFLHSQFTGDLEEGESYNEAVFLSFLERWSSG